MKLVVGLGNPGPRYQATRHNVGFRIVERWAGRRGILLDGERFSGRFGSGRLPAPSGGGLEVSVFEPLTWMNRSGAAVARAVAELPIERPDVDLIVAIDDVDLPFGRLRLRPAGGAGGHRGLADVIEALGRSDFARLRFGVGRPQEPMDTADWVLEGFSELERVQLGDHLEAATDALDAAILDGIQAAMNRFNRDPASEPSESLQ